MTITLLSFVILAITTYQICATEVVAASIQCGTITSMKMQWKDGKTERGEWPFLAALFNVKEKYFSCGGTLISSKHVLTAAHCTRDRSSWNKLLPGDIRVHLGAYDLTSNTERGVQKRDVHAIHVHPEWYVYSFESDADLAILLLSEFVLFTDYIRPICVPADDIVIHDVRGSVAGWGLTGMGTKPSTEFIQRTLVTALNSGECLTEDPTALLISSPRTFCGRNKGRDHNKGDLGGGFYVQNKESVWVQHGIVSSLRTNITGGEYTDSVVVYTDLQDFKNWIVETVSQSGVTVGETKTQFVKFNLECMFEHDIFGNLYLCVVNNLNIRSDNVAVATFFGSHLGNNTDKDVQAILFQNGTMSFIPPRIEQIFKNVKRMEISSIFSTKSIQRSDFKSLKNLVDLHIYRNNITTLDYDSLRDLRNLEWFLLGNNEVSEIDGRTFETNVRLRIVSLFHNKLEMLPRRLFTHNRLLTYVDLSYNSLETIDESTFAMNDNLIEINLSRNKLETLPTHIFRNNLLLKNINLSDNSLKTIDGSTFESNIKLKLVYLDGNRLLLLPRTLFRNNSLLDYLFLSDYPSKIIDISTFETNATLILMAGNERQMIKINNLI